MPQDFFLVKSYIQKFLVAMILFLYVTVNLFFVQGGMWIIVCYCNSIHQCMRLFPLVGPYGQHTLWDQEPILTPAASSSIIPWTLPLR